MRHIPIGWGYAPRRLRRDAHKTTEPCATYIRVVVDRVTRVGDTVRRPLQEWSSSVHDLLRHLESKDFAAPRVLGVEGDTEVLTWIDGESGAAGWAKIVPESGLRQWGQFLRTYHEAVS